MTLREWLGDWRFRLEWWLSRWAEKTTIWLVWHLPRSLVMWAFIRVAVHGNNGHPDDRSISDTLKAWGQL